MVEIIDGAGKGFKAQVNNKNELKTKADTNTRGGVVSAEDEVAFTWTSSYVATSGDEVFFLKNTSLTKRLFIDVATLCTSNACLFEMYSASLSSEPGGSVSTGQNLNLGSGKTPDSSSMGNAAVTGLTLGGKLAITSIGAGDSKDMVFDDELILTQNTSIAITAVDGSSRVAVYLRGYYDV